MNAENIISLNIETSTTLCSVALGQNNLCVDSIDADDGHYHSEKLHVFIQDILKRNALNIKDISVIAVSSGPGSYTGLRIGASAAKTLAYALNIPLIPISSLQTQAMGYLLSNNTTSPVISTMYAREKKIYFGIYTSDGQEIQAPQAFQINNETLLSLKKQYPDAVYIGSGVPLLNINNQNNESIKPYARYMIPLVIQKYQQYKNNTFDYVYFEPMYI